MENAKLTLYFIPSPFGLNWESPSKLARTIIINKYSFKPRFMGHVNIDIQFQNEQGEKEHILTGMVASNLNAVPLLLKKKIGLGILWHSFPGRLETKEELIPELDNYKKTLEAAGAMTKIVATHNGHINDDAGKPVKVDFTFLTTASVLFDAVYVPGGKKSVDALSAEADAIHFVEEAFRHCKAIAATKEGVQFLGLSKIPVKGKNDAGVVLDKTVKDFEKAIQQHRFWEREKAAKIPA